MDSLKYSDIMNKYGSSPKGSKQVVYESLEESPKPNYFESKRK